MKHGVVIFETDEGISPAELAREAVASAPGRSDLDALEACDERDRPMQAHSRVGWAHHDGFQLQLPRQLVAVLASLRASDHGAPAARHGIAVRLEAERELNHIGA